MLCQKLIEREAVDLDGVLLLRKLQVKLEIGDTVLIESAAEGTGCHVKNGLCSLIGSRLRCHGEPDMGAGEADAGGGDQRRAVV